MKLKIAKFIITVQLVSMLYALSAIVTDPIFAVLPTLFLMALNWSIKTIIEDASEYY